MEKTFYLNKEQFVAVETAWKSKKTHTAAQHVIYNILRCKPADTGFVEKTKGIQCNNPWNAFNAALIYAKWLVQPRRFGSPEHQQRAFKEAFGIDIPEDLLGKFDGLHK